MSDWAIKTVQVSKEYDLSKVHESRFIDLFRLKKKESKLKFALQPLDLEVKKGEVLGIRGVNGSGKSTLLKMLAGITRPTSGQIKMKGKVAALLEVGTGFHPDLSGRENVFLNGSILGMSRAYIKEQYQQIIAFSELESYQDVAIKKYSTGMEMRLAFSIAIHMESDIILLDEVLAVGDPAFRQKCIRRLKKLAATDKTIVVVSHDEDMLSQLSTRVITFNNGNLIQSKVD